MTFQSQMLIDSLQSYVREMILEADKLQRLPKEQLQAQPGPGRWSIAQVIEHLNFYNRHYVPAIRAKLQGHETRPSFSFRPGWLGGYFTKLMQPGENGALSRKMKAPKNAVPASQPDGVAQVKEFVDYQQQLLSLLEEARSADLGAIRIPTSLSSLLALKLGDTFRFVIAHEQRHFVQIRSAMTSD